jgi:hypothetical protein
MNHQHPATDPQRSDPEERISVRVLSPFVIQAIAINGDMEVHTAKVGETVHVERWQARDLEVRELAERI